MLFGSVCSGIEAASQAWNYLGWKAAFFSEIDKFPCAVLSHHYGSNMPDQKYSSNGIPNYGDMNNYKDWPDADISVLIGGTPCQSFSVAGLRKGLEDPRGNLMLTFGGVAKRYKPKWLLWENVPGVLSSNKGKDFGTFLGMLAELGYGFSYRILDAQFTRVDGFERAVPQRRRRVFVVGYLGDWRPTAAVLLDPQSVSGNSKPYRKTGQKITRKVSESTGSEKQVFGTLMANSGDKLWLGNQEVFSGDYHIIGIPGNWIGREPENGGNSKTPMFDISPSLTATDRHGVSYQSFVRRLTPLECERLQGFPDNYTRIPYRGKSEDKCPDGPRYKALGNSMAVNVIRWIGQRIQIVDDHINLNSET